MNYITTNIRIPEDVYMKLKMQATTNRISFSEAVRLKLSDKQKEDIDKTALIKEINKNAERLGRKLKGFNAVKAIREMRGERTKHLLSLCK